MELYDGVSFESMFNDFVVDMRYLVAVVIIEVDRT